MDRRQFLQASLGAGIAGAATLATSPIWARGINRRPFKDLGLQLYTVRGAFEQDFQSTLERIAAIGYKDLEFAGYFDHKPSEVKALMNSLGLSSHSTHVRLDAMQDRFGEAMEVASLMGQTNLTLPWIAPELRNLESYRQLADLMNKRGEEAKKSGFKLAYHNHDFEFETIDGVVPYDLLLERTDPENVFMEIDLYWVHKAGIDPLSYFRKAPGRFIACHLKDSLSDGEMAPVGNGVIDFSEIFAHAKQAGLERYYVEHDNAADPFASIAESYAYLMA